MLLNDVVSGALADLADADVQARSNMVVEKQTVVKAMDAAARLAKEAHALPGLPADRRDRMWRFFDNPYMRLAIDSGPFSIAPPDRDSGEATTQIVTADGGRFDAAGYIRRLHNDWREILDAD